MRMHARNFADIDAAQEELAEAWNAASEEMYKAGQDGAATSQKAVLVSQAGGSDC